MLHERYKILIPLGVGNMARTYLAEDTHLPGHPQCVLKQLKPSSTDPAYLDVAKRLFRREAKALQQLGQHGSIPSLIDYFEHGHEFYLVQELIDGEPLAPEEISSGKQWSEEKTIDFLQEMLGILEFVHGHRVIHRDIKPSNIMRRRSDQRLALIDFGSVREEVQASPPVEVGVGDPSLPGQDAPDGSPDGSSSEAQVPNTTPNLPTPVGTPGYMPEEQLQGEPCPASDIFALGIVAIQALTGLPVQQLGKDAEGEVIWQRYVQVSDGLGIILTKMVRRDHRLRFQSATDVRQALRRLNEASMPPTVLGVRDNTQLAASPPPKPAKKPRILAKLFLTLVGIAGVGGLAFGGWMLYSRYQVQQAEREMLTQLDALYQTSSYPECRQTAEVAISTQTSNTSPDYKSQLKNKQARCTLAEADQLADKNLLREAMLVLSDVDQDTLRYKEAQAKIKNFGKLICTQAIASAETASDQTQFLVFLNNGRSVPKFYSDYKKCQADLSKLEKDWKENEEPFQQAQKALQEGRCQEAENKLKEFSNTRFKHWGSVRSEQLERVKQCKTPLAIRGQLSDSSLTRTFRQQGFSNQLPFEQHEFLGYKGQKIVVLLTASKFDPYLYLFDPSGNSLAEKHTGDPPNKSQSGSKNSEQGKDDSKKQANNKKQDGKEKKVKIDYQLPQDGKYKIFVTKYFGDLTNNVGPYKLAVTVAQ